MKNYLFKLILPIVLVVAIGISSVLLPIKQNSNIFKKSEKVVKPTKKKKTKEEKARRVGERLKFEFDLQKNPKTGKIPKGIKQLEQKAAQKVPVFGQQAASNGGIQKTNADINITTRGPGNLGGRTRAIAFDARNSNIMLAGGVSSGVFRSTDKGASWTKVSSNSEIHDVTAIVQDPRTGQQDTWYYGTGETGSSASLGADYLGHGIWKSTDNGLTWSALTSTQTDLESFDEDFDYVHRLVVDPTNGYIYAAAAEAIHRSTDGGTTWSTVLGNTSDDKYTDIVVTSGGRLYAAFDGTLNNNGVWASNSGAINTWTKIAGAGSPTNHANWNAKDSYGRVVLAIAPSNENIVYALYDNKTESKCSGTAAPEAEMFVWNQVTTTWTDLSANLPDEAGCSDGNDPFAIQGGYDLVVKIKPDNPSTVFIGGTNLYRSTDGFTSTNNTTRIGGYKDATGYSAYDLGGGVTHHPDIHEVIFAPDNNDVLYCGSDGGIHSADITNGVVGWASLNNNYITYQYYHCDISPTNGSNLLIGGAQDNGTTAISTGTTGFQMAGGDGVAVGVITGATTNAFHAIYGTQEGDISRETYVGGSSDDYFEIKPTTATNSIFVTYFYLDQDNTNYLYYANGGGLFRTRIAESISAQTVTGNSATGWEDMTGVGGATTDNIRSMATSRGASYSATDANRKLYIGTANGKVLRLNDPAFATAATAPVDITPSGAGGGIVSGIAVHPEDDNEVLVTYSNYGIIGVFHTTNANAATPTWTTVEGSTTAVQLASIRSCLIVKGTSSNYYFVGTSTGLYCTSTLNGASTVWEKVGPNDIGYAVVSSIRLRPSDNNFVVGTHGNGMFQLSFSSCTSPTVAVTGNSSFCQGDNVTLDAGTYANAPNTYSWTGGATTQTVAYTASGTYTVTVTVGGGCSGTATVQTTSNTPPTASISGNSSYCSADGSTTLDAGSHTSYMWSNGMTGQTIAATAGAYTVTVNDGNSCTATATTTVTQNTSPTPTISGSLTYCTGGNTTLDAGNYTSFVWSNTATTQTITATAGTYIVTVTDGNGCTGTTSAAVSANSGVSVTIGGNLSYCANEMNTTLDAGSHTSYVWSNAVTTQTITATAGSYTVTVTDGNGCTGTASAAVSANSGVSVTIGGNLSYCANEMNTTLDAGSHTSYMWSNGMTSQTISAMAGSYTVTVTDGNSCTGAATAAVTQNSNPTVSISGNTSYCSADGSTTLDAGSHTSYMWSNGMTSQTIAAMAGSYTVTVTDGNSCTAIATTAVTQNTNPSPSISGSLTYCTGGNTTLDAGSYASYVWSNAATTQTVTATTGNYTVTVTDGNGCTGTASAAVSAGGGPSVNITQNSVSCNTTLDAGTYAPVPNTYMWSSGETAQSIAATAAGVYTVTVTDNNSCTGTATTQVQSACNAYVSGLTHNADSICPDDMIDVKVSNVQMAAGYQLLYILFEVDNLGATTYVDSNATGEFSAAPGDYQVCAYVELTACAPNPSPFTSTVNSMADIGMVQNGCYEHVCSNTITVPEPFEALAGTGQTANNNSTGNNVYVIEVCGGEQPYNADLDASGGFATSQALPSENAGCINYQITYVDGVDWTLTITDANDCSDANAVFTSDGIPSNPIPQINEAVVSPETCPGDLNGSIKVEVEGGDSSCSEYSYTATGPNYTNSGNFDAPPANGVSTFILEELGAGTYNIIVTDCAGTTAQIDIYVNRKHVGGRGGRGRGRGCSNKMAEQTNGLLETWNVFPNPLAEQTTLEFVLSDDAHVNADLYSLEGRKVATIFESDVNGGELYYLPLEFTNHLPSGVYLLQFTMSNGTVYYEKLYVAK